MVSVERDKSLKIDDVGLVDGVGVGFGGNSDQTGSIRFCSLRIGVFI